MEISSPITQQRWSLAREMTATEIANLDKFGTMVALDTAGRFYKILELDYHDGDESRAHTSGLKKVLTEDVIPPPQGFAGKYRIVEVSSHQQ